MKTILLGGSPCTNWSIAKREGRETQPSGEGWELFLNYLIAKEKFQPDIFLYENNVSAAKAIKDEIKKRLEVDNINNFYNELNSELVSAQMRKRFYVHNCGKINTPADRHIMFQDILEHGYAPTNKAYCLTASYGGAVVWNSFERSQRSMVAEANGPYIVENGRVYINGNYYGVLMPDGKYDFRKLTAVECCRLQTLPDNYCNSISRTQAYKCTGNGWTAEIIKHILKSGLEKFNVDKDEKLIVLSMYDGIATGRYCLESLGYHNIEYYAYEIDKFAMKVANSNYPDIIQCGDAFQVRNEDWRLKY